MYRLIITWHGKPIRQRRRYYLKKKIVEGLVSTYCQLGYEDDGYDFKVEKLCRHWFKLYWAPAIIEVAREQVFTGEDHL